MRRSLFASISLRAVLPLCLATVSGCAVVNPNNTADVSGFSKDLEWNDDIFEIRSSGGNLTIRTFGQDEGNEIFEHPIQGRVAGAETADLNHDGFPEVLVYLVSPDAASFGTVIGYSSNNGKSMSPISFPPPASNPQVNQGYQGHDTFSSAQDVLVQSFPVFRAGDAPTHPTGPTRQVQYALVDGENSRALEVSRTFEN